MTDAELQSFKDELKSEPNRVLLWVDDAGDPVLGRWFQVVVKGQQELLVAAADAATASKIAQLIHPEHAIESSMVRKSPPARGSYATFQVPAVVFPTDKELLDLVPGSDLLEAERRDGINYECRSC